MSSFYQNLAKGIKVFSLHWVEILLKNIGLIDGFHQMPGFKLNKQKLAILVGKLLEKVLEKNLL